MGSNKLAFVAVSIACVAAAGGGSYLATRQNQANAALAAPASAPAVNPSTTTSPLSSLAQPADSAVPGTAAASTPVSESSAAASTPVAPASPTVPAAPAEPARASRAASTSASSTRAVARDRVRAATPQTTVASADRNAPSSAPAQAAAAPVQAPPAPAAAPQLDASPAPAPPLDAAQRQDDVRPPEPVRLEPDKAPEKTFDELVVSADSVIGVQLDTALSSETAKVEDRVDARVVRDVRVGTHVAIPAGARAIGSVTVAERGGKMKDRARLGIRFNTIVLADGTRIPVSTETIFRYGDAPGNAAAQKVGGGAVIGTILGGILGGAKGAAVGAAAGAGGGAAAAAAGDRSPAEFPAGMQMTARFLAPVTVTVER